MIIPTYKIFFSSEVTLFIQLGIINAGLAYKKIQKTTAILRPNGDLKYVVLYEDDVKVFHLVPGMYTLDKSLYIYN